jgi:hypothetical protein
MFDPYHKWLGIRPGQRPPNYYQLLGIDENEKDPEVIEEQAMSRTAHVRTYQAGQHAEDCKRVLGELALARATLLKPEKRRDYDAKLRAAAPKEPAPIPVAPVHVTVRQPVEERPTVHRHNGAEAFAFAPTPVNDLPLRAPSEPGNWFKLWVVGGVLVILMCGAVSIALLFLFAPHEQTRPGSVAVVPPTQPTSEPKTAPPTPATKVEAKNDTEPKEPKEPKDPPEPKVVAKEKPKIDLDPPAPPDRMAVPTEEAQQAAEKSIKALFKTEYAKISDPTKARPADLRALADKLLQRGVETGDDGDARYVLYREAHDLAVRGTDGIIAFQATEEMDRDYDVKGLELKLADLEKAAGWTNSVTTNKRLAERALMAADRAVAGDQFELALKFLKLAKSFGLLAKSAALNKRLQDRGDEIERQKIDFEPVPAAIAKIKGPDEDADARVLVGKYFCVWKGDWERGCLLLFGGSDPALKLAARKENVKPKEHGPMVEAADAWWELANKTEKGPLKTAMARRAQYWYRMALPDLVGLTYDRVETRLKDLDKQYPLETPGQWDQFDVTHATPIGNWLRINGLRGARSKESFTGGIDITLEVRLEKDSLCIEAGQGGGLVISPPTAQHELRVYRPGVKAQPLSGTFVAGQSCTLVPGEWYKIRWRLNEKQMRVSVDDREIFRENGPYDLTVARPVRVRGLDGWVDVKSLKVTAQDMKQ